MDHNDLRALFTVVAVVIFVAIVVWAYSSKRKASFDEAANIVFDEGRPTQPMTAQSNSTIERNS